MAEENASFDTEGTVQAGQTMESAADTAPDDAAGKDAADEQPIIVAGSNRCGCDSGGVATPGIKGRVGADDYAIDPAEWDKQPMATCDVLYSMGGVYGNLEAMRTVLEMVEKESGEVCIVYNGDYHWFDGTAENFAEVERLLEGCIATNGNVELELARMEDCGVGCGCSYPTSMSDAFVGRSNAIFGRMKESLAGHEKLLADIPGRVAWGVVEVRRGSGNPDAGTAADADTDAGNLRVGITHGDEKSVSGWGCSVDSLQEPERIAELEQFFAEHDVDVLSTTHTCAAAARAFEHGAVINNGSAGLPEYRGRLYGLVNRVAATPHPDAIYRTMVKGMYVEAVPVRYDHEAFIEWFDSVWEPDSPAAQSYRPRAVAGPDTEFVDAVFDGFEILVD